MRRRSFILIAILVVVGLYANRSLLFSAGILEQYSSLLVYPVLQAQQKVVLPIKQMLMHRRTCDDLEQQLATIRNENELLKAENIQLQGSLRYAQDISELIEFRKNYAYPNAILAHVLAKNISEQAHFMLLDAGANKGVKKNMVAVYNNHLIGKIIEVYPWYSKVQLVTDRDCKVAACCATTNAIGIHEGCNQGTLARLNRVSHLAQLQEGDLVLSSGEGLIFPQGFGLGRVTAFRQEGLNYHVDVAPLIDIHSINYCCIIAKS